MPGVRVEVCVEGGICHACPAGRGVITEEEMLIMGGLLYVETPQGDSGTPC